MAIETIKVPDIGGAEGVEVIELSVSVGDIVAVEDSIIVVETDKASMDLPTPVAGKIIRLKVAEGDKVSEGDLMVEIEVDGAVSTADKTADSEAASIEVAATEPTPVATAAEQTVVVPDLGGSDNVEVIEVCVAPGDEIAEGDSIIVLETDKASMEIPAPFAGKVVSIAVNEGGKVSVGDAMAVLLVAGSTAVEPVVSTAATGVTAVTQNVTAVPVTDISSASEVSTGNIYAGPAVRKLARQLGVNLDKIKASGPRGRLNKDDVRSYVKDIVNQVENGTSGAGIPVIPAVDFSKFGDVELVKLSKIQKITANNMARNWLNVPHVTQWDDADITELEGFRKGLKSEAEKRGSKLTPLPFLLKACAAALRAEASFNVSLHADGEHIVQKDYVHIGIAVDSPVGLMVPVIRDVDTKGLWELADEFTEIVAKARTGKLMPRDMQGGCFTISSLGAMGGKGFTPIVNAPEVAILGVSRAQMKPIWNGKDFEPRNMLPLSLSYDHRAVNGADAGRFFTYLTSVLGDVRRLLL